MPDAPALRANVRLETGRTAQNASHCNLAADSNRPNCMNLIAKAKCLLRHRSLFIEPPFCHVIVIVIDKKTDLSIGCFAKFRVGCKDILNVEDESKAFQLICARISVGVPILAVIRVKVFDKMP